MSRSRLTWLVVLLASSAPLLAARCLSPSASGVGTHVQLGLPPCGFLRLFQLPCPACGLTTSFAHLVRGDLGSSLQVHPLGLPLALLLVAVALRACVGLARAESVGAWLRVAAGAGVALFVTAALGLAWFGRIVGQLLG